MTPEYRMFDRIARAVLALAKDVNRGGGLLDDEATDRLQEMCDGLVAYAIEIDCNGTVGKETNGRV